MLPWKVLRYPWEIGGSGLQGANYLSEYDHIYGIHYPDSDPAASLDGRGDGTSDAPGDTATPTPTDREVSPVTEVEPGASAPDLELSEDEKKRILESIKKAQQHPTGQKSGLKTGEVPPNDGDIEHEDMKDKKNVVKRKTKQEIKGNGPTPKKFKYDFKYQ